MEEKKEITNEEENTLNLDIDPFILKIFVSLIIALFSLVCYMNCDYIINFDVDIFILIFSIVGLFFISFIVTYIILSIFGFLNDIVKFYLKFKDVDLKELIEDYKKEKE